MLASSSVRSPWLPRLFACVVCVFTCACALLAVPAAAQSDDDPESDVDPWAASRPEDLTIKLVTFGPGDAVFNYFGHNALIVDDRAAHMARLYNFGMFHFGAAMLPNYLKGKLTFWVGEAPVRATFAHYEAMNRSVRIQELNISPAKRKLMAHELATVVLPEHRNYLYDHFFNNCSTRLRDLIDQAVNGQFKQALEHSGRMTYRQHIRRYAQHDPAADFALVFWMNKFMERPIKQWDELFLPEELEHQVARMQYRDEQGHMQALLSTQYTVFEAHRPATPDGPNRGYPMAALIGFAIGACALALAWWAALSQRRLPVRLLGVHHALFGFVLGVPGLLGMLMWIFTEHTVTYANENQFLSNPLTFALFPLGIAVAFGSRAALTGARWISYALCVSSLLLVALKLLPSFYQDTSLPMGLFLPINVLLAVAHWKLSQHAASATAPVATQRVVSRA